MAAAWMLFGAAAYGRPPNIVLLYADDMGIGDVGCYGCQDIRTPNIDHLARTGVRFTNYYSAAPICSPSRAALLTGRYPIRAGVPTNAGSIPTMPDGMPAEEVTVAELAKTRGYATALIGKWHLGYAPGQRPNDQGFDFFFGFHAGCVDYYSHMFYWHEPHNHDLYRNREEIHEEGQYMTEMIAREACGFIERQTHGRDARATNARATDAVPFLLYVPFNAPHYPMQAPQRLLQMYEKLPAQRRDYAALVAGLDEAIGRIMERLRQQELIEDTLVFFASDNGATTELRANGGGGSNVPYRGYKFSLFDGGIHMPAIVSWPGKLPQNETRDGLAIAMDVFPTVAEIIGAELPKNRTIDGASWTALLKDAAAPGHDVLFWEQAGQRAVRQGRWKLVVNGADAARGDKRREAEKDSTFLADMESDPGERTNVQAQHPDLVEKLLSMHASWRKSLKER